MKTIILDTNFLMLPTEAGVDIFEELKRILSIQFNLKIIDKTRAELLNLIETGKTKQKLAAKIALKLIQTYNIQEIKTTTNDHVDNQILTYISENTDCMVATMDAALKTKLKIKGIQVIVCRKNQYLELIK